MRRADRLLQIIQVLRREARPVSGRFISDELEVSLRTLYRDMVALEAATTRPGSRRRRRCSVSIQTT